MTRISDLTNAQLSTIFAKAGMGSAAQRHANVYNQIRCGAIHEVVGALKAGCSSETHRKARKALRRALREEGVEI